jgi:hypothetical protein
LRFVIRTHDLLRRNDGDVAQLVEHLLCKQGVVGSIPSISTICLVLSEVRVSGGCPFKIQVQSFMGKIEFRFSVGLFLKRSDGTESRMFAPSFNVEEQICSLSG